MVRSLRALLSLFAVALSPTAACAAPAPNPAIAIASGGAFSIGAIAANKRRGTISPPPATVAYDTAMGATVDANGFTTLPLRVGAHRYFVKPSGSDANSCTTAENAATPKATLTSATTCIIAGEGDQVLLAEGATFAEHLPKSGDAAWMASMSGFSALYPTVFSSYDPTDPTNEAKYGRGDQRSARPVLTGTQGLVGNGTWGYVAIKGLDFNPGNVANQGLSFQGSSHYILLENNIFRYTGVSFDSTEATTVFPTTPKIIIRNNSLYGMFSSTDAAHTGGAYIAGFVGPTLEDNVFYHNGWEIGVSRDCGVDCGGPTVFNHSYYIQTNTTGAIVRRNLSVDGAGDGGIARGDSTFTENLFIDNPAATGLGGGPDYGTERPTGVTFDASYNAILGDADVTSSHTLGWGINSTNGTPGSRIHDNLIVRSRNINGPSMSGFSNNASFNQPSFAEYEHNLMWNWVASTGQVYFATCGSFPAQCHTSYDYNNWDGAAAGTNANSASTTFPNAYTAATFYTALGYADKTSFINYMIGHPESHLQRTARQLLFTGYGVATESDTTPPALSSPTASSPSAGNATIAVTTNEGNGTLYYQLLTTGTAPNPSQVKFGLDASNAAAVQPGSITVSSSGTKSVNLSGVPPGTYFAHFAQEDVAGNKSSVATSASFSIASATATWNGANSSTDWTLSNGNLTANRTSTGAGFWAMLRGTTAKTSGTIIVKVDALGGGLLTAIGFDAGAETQYPGQEGSGGSIGYRDNGSIVVAGATVATVASYTTGDCVKETRTSASFAFYKQTACTGSFVLQTTYDTAAAGDMIASVAAYPAASNGNSTGTQLTLDASGW